MQQEPNAIVDGLLTEDVAGFFLGLGGLALDMKGLTADGNANRLMAFGGPAPDGVGLYTGVNGILGDISCEATATG